MMEYQNSLGDMQSNRKKLNSISEVPSGVRTGKNGEESGNSKERNSSMNENNFQDQFSAFPVDPGYNKDGSKGTGQLFSGGDPVQDSRHSQASHQA